MLDVAHAFRACVLAFCACMLCMHVGMVCPVNAIDMLEMLCMLNLTQITPHNLVLGDRDSRLLRYTHAHHVPHAKHMESCRLDEMAKRGRDDSASVPLLCSLSATLCCPPPILFTGQGAK